MVRNGKATLKTVCESVCYQKSRMIMNGDLDSVTKR